MTKNKKSILVIASILMLLFMSLSLVGCAGEDNESAYINVVGIVAQQDITINEALATAIFIYEVPEGSYDEKDGKPDKVELYGLSAMKSAGVSIIWSGSSAEEIEKNNGIIFQFSFRGEVKSITVPVTATN